MGTSPGRSYCCTAGAFAATTFGSRHRHGEASSGSFAVLQGLPPGAHGGEQQAVGQAGLIALLCWLVGHADAPQRVYAGAAAKSGGDNVRRQSQRRPRAINGSTRL
jgi:hypothetical protein